MELSPCEDLFICPTGFGVNWGMKIMIEFMIKGKQVTVMPATEPDKPVVYLNTFANEVNSVYKNLQALCCPDFNLVAISKLKWDHDMTPWYMPPISKRDAPCTGGADDYLRLMIEEIIPKAEKENCRYTRLAWDSRIFPWRSVCCVCALSNGYILKSGKYVRITVV